MRNGYCVDYNFVKLSRSIGNCYSWKYVTCKFFLWISMCFFNFKNSNSIAQALQFYCKFFNVHRNFGNVVTNLFDYFFSFLLLFRIGQFVTTEIDYAEEQCDLRYAWNEVKRSCLLPPSWEEWSVLQLHRISLRATWYQARFYASIFEKYLLKYMQK